MESHEVAEAVRYLMPRVDDYLQGKRTPKARIAGELEKAIKFMSEHPKETFTTLDIIESTDIPMPKRMPLAHTLRKHAEGKYVEYDRNIIRVSQAGKSPTYVYDSECAQCLEHEWLEKEDSERHLNAKRALEENEKEVRRMFIAKQHGYNRKRVSGIDSKEFIRISKLIVDNGLGEYDIWENDYLDEYVEK